ncbi:MAG: DegQ family serine endoprotease [Nitrospirota bacterium]|nr:MAG: DegQ family serine endoprotease [Nitrospirota bacterium]
MGIAGYYFLYSGDIKSVLQKKQAPVPSARLNIEETNRSFTSIVKAISPSVVNISTVRKPSRESNPYFNDPLYDLFPPFRDDNIPQKRQEQSLGSGVIVSVDGYIITNFHVVEDANEIKVTLVDKAVYKGKVIGVDPKTDIAVVKIEASDLPAVSWGDSESLQVGEFILAIGNPFGLNNTVTMGIISAVGRANVGIADYEDFIQTDAAINPGNSGGPLVNVSGELIGINTAIFSRSGGYQGIGFAVPSNMAKAVFGQLVEKGKVIRGWIGVSIQDLNMELASNFGLSNTKGALVSDVIEGGPAEAAGIRRGDIISSFNGKVVENVSTLRNMVAQSKIGSTHGIKIIRNKKVRELKVLVSELPKEYTESGPYVSDEEIKQEVLGGITVIELTREIARQLRLGSAAQGVVIVNLEAGSLAETSGLRKGDVLQEIDAMPIRSLDDFNKAVSSIKENKDIILFVNRSGKKFYIALKQ